ncbi:MAG: DUF983 domain-containing protein [Hyphomicrobiales bacterium]|nr:DUF983 domain-containing protein [Hyphomicrobiales bacterium]
MTTTNTYTPVPGATEEHRDCYDALKRGWRGRCPHCGEGKLYYKFLKPRDICEACGEELHHHRADDAPPYITIVIVGHILGAIMLFAHERDLNLSVWTEAIGYPLLGLLVALWALPKIKGALIGYQWALRMHGFETAQRPGTTAPTSAAGTAAS